MKYPLLAAALLATFLPAAAANVDVGVSIGISQPGVYGRIDIGRFQPPQFFVQQPVIIGRPIITPVHPPVYLWVPAVQQQNWGRHCSRYGACGVPVFFVQERWYRDPLAVGPRYDPRHAYRDSRRDGHRGGGRDDRNHGSGNGRGNGNGWHKHR